MNINIIFFDLRFLFLQKYFILFIKNEKNLIFNNYLIKIFNLQNIVKKEIM